MKKRILSMLIAIVMVVGMIPMAALTAFAEEDIPLAIGDNKINDGNTYTYTAERDGPLYVTVTELFYGESGIVFEGYLNSWVAISINGTPITAFANTVEVSAGDTVTVAMESLDGDIYHGTVNLSWDAPVFAEITGVTITVDDVTYTSGNVTITPNTQSIILTVTGTNFANVSTNNCVLYARGGISYLNSGAWTINTADNTATRNFSADISDFETCKHFEVQYSNDGRQSWNATGICLTYDDGIAEEDRAKITGVTITVDGEIYTEGEVIITPTSTIVYTVTGTNFANVSADNYVWYAPGCGDYLNGDWWTFDLENNTATFDFSAYISDFENCDNFEVQYSNDGQQTWNNTGIYLTYDDGTGGEEGGEVDTTPAEITGVSITVDGVIYTEGNVTITPTSTVVYTVYGTNFANVSSMNLLMYARGSSSLLNSGWWTINTADNTATCDFSEYILWFENCDNFEVQYSNAGQQTWKGTGIYLTYDDGIAEEDRAKITGVTITVDGVPYTEGEVIITPTSTIVYTVSGTNFANLSAENFVRYTLGGSNHLNSGEWTINTADNTATLDRSAYISRFENCDNFEVQYSNDGMQTWNGTGIYLTYDDGTGGEVDTTPAEITGVTITVDGVIYTEGDVTITPTSTIVITVTGTNFANVSAENFVWYAPNYGSELNSGECTVDTGANTATLDLSEYIYQFENCDNYEVQYSNDGQQSWNDTGIYLTYVKPAPDSTGKIAVDMRDQYRDSWNGAEIEIYKNGSIETTATVEREQTFNTVFLDYDSTASYEFKWIKGTYDSECSFTIYVDGEAKLAVSDASALEDGETILTLNDDGTGGEVDTTPAEITGVTITVDGTAYGEGETAIITPDSTVMFHVTGTNLDKLGSNAYIFYAEGTVVLLDTPEEGATQITVSVPASDFNGLTTAFEIRYALNLVGELIETGLYVRYDNLGADAEITGVRLNVDGTDYTGGTAVIKPDSSVTITLLGQNLSNINNRGHKLNEELSLDLTLNHWVNNDDGTERRATFSGNIFSRFTSETEIVYTNDMNNYIGSGVYVIYDDGIAEEDRAKITDVTITVDDVPYTSGNVTITPTSTVVYTVYGTNFANVSTNNLVWYAPGGISCLNSNNWTINTGANTATWDLSENISQFENCDNFEVQYSNDGMQSWNCTGIYLTYDDGIAEEDRTKITGVTITVDGVPYTEGEVIITPNTQSIVLTVTGTNFANVSTNNLVSYAPGGSSYLNSNNWTINTGANTATWDRSAYISQFENCDNFEVQYSNDGMQTWNGTGIYLTYVKPAPDSTGKIAVDMKDQYGDGWNYAEIEIYKNGSIETTATVNATFNTVFLDYDSTASYEFKWIKGIYDSECSFTIYVDGEAKLAVSDASALEDGETILTLNDDGTGGEVDTTPAKITGVSITVDGVPYTEGEVIITPNSTIVYTVSGTNFANLSTNNLVWYARGGISYLNSGEWTINTADNTATLDRSAYISRFEDCDNFEVQYSNAVEQTWNGTGIYLTYDDGIAEEDRAKITGVTITVDGVPYTEGEVIITPTSTIVITVTGTNFANLSAENFVWYTVNGGDYLNNGEWTINTADNTATSDFSAYISRFENCNNFEVQYSNDGEQTWNGTGIYLTYDDGTGGEEDTTPAKITGVSITVDGVPYTEGEVTITPNSTIIYTVTGTNFANVSGDNSLDCLELYPGGITSLADGAWVIDTADNTATWDLSGRNDLFNSCDNFEVQYSNDGGKNWNDTGIYLTYDDGTGGEVDTTPAKITGASITAGVDLTMNYYVNLIDTTLVGEGQQLAMQFTMNGKTVTVIEYTIVDGEYVFAFENIAPQQMADLIDATLVVVDENGEIVKPLAEKKGYSVKANAEKLLEVYKDDAALVQFVTDMLYYGAAAQNYKDYNVENLANAGVENLGTPSEALPTESIKNITASTSENVYFTSATVWFDNVNKIGVYLSTVENVTLKVNGEAVQLTGTTYYTDAIYATGFDTVYTFKLYEGDTLVQTLTYSVSSYVYAMMDKVDGEGNPTNMAELAKELYRYGASAVAYKNAQNSEI